MEGEYHSQAQTRRPLFDASSQVLVVAFTTALMIAVSACNDAPDESRTPASRTPKAPHVQLALPAQTFERPADAAEVTLPGVAKEGIKTFIARSDHNLVKATASYVKDGRLIAVDYSLVDDPGTKSIAGDYILADMLNGYQRKGSTTIHVLTKNFEETEIAVEIWEQSATGLSAYHYSNEGVHRLIFYRPQDVSAELLLPDIKQMPKELLDRAKHTIEAIKKRQHAIQR